MNEVTTARELIAVLQKLLPDTPILIDRDSALTDPNDPETTYAVPVTQGYFKWCWQRSSMKKNGKGVRKVVVL